MKEFVDGRHLFLYAKGHYIKSSQGMIEDLRYVIGETCMLPPHLVSEDDIYRVCINVVVSFCKKYQPERTDVILGDLLKEIGKEHLYEDAYFTKGRSPRIAIIQECLSVLSQVKIFDGEVELVPVGKADPDVLPIRALAEAQSEFIMTGACSSKS